MSQTEAAGRVLIVDDDLDTCELMKMVLDRTGLEVEIRTSPVAALERLAESDFDVVLTDIEMSEMAGLELCRRAFEKRPELVAIVITGQGSVDTVIAAMQLGAFNFLVKPVRPQLLELSVARALSYRRLKDEVARLRTA